MTQPMNIVCRINNMALGGMLEAFATLFNWLCQGVLWIFGISFNVVSSVVLYIAEFVFLVCGTCMNAGRLAILGMYSNVLPAFKTVAETLVSYVPLVWYYAKLLGVYLFHFAYNVCVSTLEWVGCLAVHTFSFFKWFVQCVCTDAALYTWSGMATALEWTRSALMVVASYAVAVAMWTYSLAVQGFWVTCNAVVLTAESAYPVVCSMLSYGAQASACVFDWMYSVCAALLHYGYSFVVQVYEMVTFCVAYIWSGAVPASVYIWSVAVAGFEWVYSLSYAAGSYILLSVCAVLSVVAEGVLSAWRVVVNALQRTYPVIADVLVVGLQWVGNIRFSVHMRWIADGLWGAVCSVGSLLVMAAAQVWAMLVLIFTFLYSTLFKVFNMLLWTANFVGYNVFAVVCCIVVITVIVVVGRKILSYTGVTGRRVAVMVVQLLNQLFAFIRTQRRLGRGTQLQGHQVREGGTQPVQRNRADEDRQIRATRQQQDLLRSVVQSTHQTDNNDHVCVVCILNEKAIMLRPCNHVCLCIECSKSIHQLNGQCPVCRSQFTSTERVYI